MKKIFLSIYLFFLPIYCFAVSPSEQLVNLLDKMHSMQANFTQIVTSNGQQNARSSGKMYWQRPGKFRWEVEKPSKQMIVVDGNFAWVYDADLAQVTKQKFNQNNVNNPAILLSGESRAIVNEYHIKLIQDKAGQSFQLIPKKPGNTLFQKVDLLFKKGKLFEMRVVDNLGQVSTFIFANGINNPQFDQSMFQFKVPRNVDVVEQ